MIFPRVAVFGVGLIGSSVALALKAAGAAGFVTGIDRDPEVLDRALALGIIERAELEGKDALARCDLVLLAVPVAQSAVILQAIAPFLESTTVIIDTGSTKTDVIKAARGALGERIAQFVACHPLAGGERHGPEAARADLFSGKKVVVSPIAENRAADIERVKRAWEACGAQVVRVDALEHDRILAAVSHLPHLIAYALMDQVASAPDGALKMSLAANGFRDATRIAASSPEMWRDIALTNRVALLEQLDAYLERLAIIRADLDQGDGPALLRLFLRASHARRTWQAES